MIYGVTSQIFVLAGPAAVTTSIWQSDALCRSMTWFIYTIHSYLRGVFYLGVSTFINCTYFTPVDSMLWCDDSYVN